MRITKIEIRNWRSIKEVEFYPTDVTALIGPNSAGKTNILSALAFLLGERWPTVNALHDGDYYGRDRSRPIYISASFDGAPDNIARVWFSSADGLKMCFEGNDRPYNMTSTRRELVPLVYLDAARSYETTFSQSQWSLFGRIVRELDANFRANQPEQVQRQVKTLLSEAHELLRTDLYRAFETSIAESFSDQIRLTTHQVKFDFRNFDPLNFYKTLHPILVEHAVAKSPAEVGSGLRNLIVMALFRAYASVLRRGAIVAIEEPEIYLHPHAQRSLAAVFEEIAAGGSQIFYSTHSPTFVAPARADRIVLVERCSDDDEDVCTQVNTASVEQLVRERQRLHPSTPMTASGVQERYRQLCEPEHADAYFARVVVIVEGPTEAAALPIFAEALGVDIDALGVSVVPARGKTLIDSFFQLYRLHKIAVFAIFDNDTHKNDRDTAWNRVLTRMLGLVETETPEPGTGPNYAILDGDYERAMRQAVNAERPGLYEELKAEAVAQLGESKPLVARFMAVELVQRMIIPPFIRDIVANVGVLARQEGS